MFGVFLAFVYPSFCIFVSRWKTSTRCYAIIVPMTKRPVFALQAVKIKVYG